MCVCVCVCVTCPLHRREPLRKGLLIYLTRSLRACAKRDTSVRLAGCRFLRCQTPRGRRIYLVVIADDELDHLHLGSSSPAPRESLLQPALTAGTLAGALTMRSGSWVTLRAFLLL